MIKELIHDPILLARKSEIATKEDLQVAQDLLDTLIAHKDGCVGMAANMIGVRKRALALFIEDSVKVIFNPVIVSSSDPYDTEEGCLSLEGERKTKRFEFIQLLYFDWKGREKFSTFSSLEAEVIQHEIDHMNGIII